MAEGVIKGNYYRYSDLSSSVTKAQNVSSANVRMESYGSIAVFFFDIALSSAGTSGNAVLSDLPKIKREHQQSVTPYQGSSTPSIIFSDDGEIRIYAPVAGRYIFEFTVILK